MNSNTPVLNAAVNKGPKTYVLGDLYLGDKWVGPVGVAPSKPPATCVAPSFTA